MKKAWAQKQTGFTIVELLIVIVVIAILAAVSIVAYNGVQQRANDTKRKDDVAKIAKALSMWSISTGKSFEEMNIGYVGASATGWFSSNYSGGGATNTILINSNYLTDGVKEPDKGSMRDYMTTRCTTAADNRRVVLARLDSAPEQTINQQLQGSGCSNVYINSFISNYGMNYAVVASGQ